MATQLKTIKASGIDYSTWSSWEDAAAISSTTTDPWHGAQDAFDASQLKFGTWADPPTAEAHRVKCYAAAGQGHGGGWSSGATIVNASWACVWSGAVSFVTIDGLRLQNTRASSTGEGVLINSTCSGWRVRNCLIEATNAGNGNGGVYVQAGSGETIDDLIVENCVLRGANDGIYISTLSGANPFVITVRNCTVYDKAVFGVYVSATTATTTTVTLQNVLALTGAADYLWSGVVDTSTYQNLVSDDSTADNSGGTGHQVDQVIADVWTNAAGGDFTLPVTSNAVGAGVSIAGLTHDILGRPRRGRPYDVGAYAFPRHLANSAGRQGRTRRPAQHYAKGPTA